MLLCAPIHSYRIPFQYITNNYFHYNVSTPCIPNLRSHRAFSLTHYKSKTKQPEGVGDTQQDDNELKKENENKRLSLPRTANEWPETPRAVKGILEDISL